MLEDEEYFMLLDLARKQELATGKVNISLLSRETGYDRKTIARHLSLDQPSKHPQTRNKPSKLDPFKPYIQERLNNYPRLSRVRLLEEIQDLGYDGGPTILGDYIRQIRPNITIPAEIRYETKPGEMMQCDWLEYPYETADGSRKKVYGLSMVLGYSRMRYVEFFPNQGLPALLKGHLGAFEYFGGVTDMILYDNLRSVVLDRKYPSTASEFHPLFADFRDHFGFTSRLCRLGRAKTKGKVERAIHYIKDNFLYGRTFHSIEDLNLQARKWLNCVNGKVHGTTHEIPFDRQVRENLRPFSSYKPYLLKRKESRKVSKDCYISLYGNSYSVPWKFAGRRVDAYIHENHVSIHADGTEICTHILLNGRNERSKKKEHFEGLYKEVLGLSSNGAKKERVNKPAIDQHSVETRDLAEYDVFAEEGRI
ncbi:transposase [Methanocalculus alkaliphilus]|uniref:IS21 family transposase n=2 Tax=Methanocalculus TaxID=71151 RepID=UPI0020A13752|nr:IS21 family transposase [Methanocalculus alkaliphilus]MCP1716377.1 transposase [Methanocalculus alkaliphilus]